MKSDKVQFKTFINVSNDDTPTWKPLNTGIDNLVYCEETSKDNILTEIPASNVSVDCVVDDEMKKIKELLNNYCGNNIVSVCFYDSLKNKKVSYKAKIKHPLIITNKKKGKRWIKKCKRINGVLEFKVIE